MAWALGGRRGQDFRPLAYTAALAMLGSLVYSVFFAPVFAHLLMRRPPRPTARRSAGRLYRLGGTFGRGLGAWSALLDRTLTRVFRPVVRFFVGERLLAVGRSVALVVVGVASALAVSAPSSPRPFRRAPSCSA